MKPRLLLAVPVAVAMVSGLPGTAQAADTGSVHAEARVGLSMNWVDNAIVPAASADPGAPRITAGGARHGQDYVDRTLARQSVSRGESALLTETAAAAVDVLRVIADLSGSCVAPRSGDR